MGDAGEAVVLTETLQLAIPVALQLPVGVGLRLGDWDAADGDAGRVQESVAVAVSLRVAVGRSVMERVRDAVGVPVADRRLGDGVEAVGEGDVEPLPDPGLGVALREGVPVRSCEADRERVGAEGERLAVRVRDGGLAVGVGEQVAVKRAVGGERVLEAVAVAESDAEAEAVEVGVRVGVSRRVTVGGVAETVTVHRRDGGWV